MNNRGWGGQNKPKKKKIWIGVYDPSEAFFAPQNTQIHSQMP
jgi:hypothetical protein